MQGSGKRLAGRESRNVKDELGRLRDGGKVAGSGGQCKGAKDMMSLGSRQGPGHARPPRPGAGLRVSF